MQENPLFPPLNLPAFDALITLSGGKRMIFDPLRRKHVALTPEEWVRQHFIHYLIKDKGYPPNLLGNEIAIRLNGTAKRCDSIVYSPYLSPLMIIEYKAPCVAINKSVFDQICRYNIPLKVRYLTVSNGLSHYCCMIDSNSRDYSFMEAIPSYGELI